MLRFLHGQSERVFDSLFAAKLPPLVERSSRVLEPEVPVAESNGTPVIDLSSLSPAPFRYRVDDGNKFPGGFGETEFLYTDYWTLRARSSQLFKTNLYARGILRRLITNEINTGLHLEATPEEAILGMEEDSLADWSETVENRFSLWCDEKTLCDHYEQQTFGQLQAQARLEALIDGDVLCVLRQDQRTGLPRVQLVPGSNVQTPYPMPKRPGVRIVDGVELDSLNRHVAYWIRQEDGTSKRLPAWGEKTGRRLAWLVYGVEKRIDEVRGTPMLSLVLQSLREIDRYRDSTQRKAVLNSILALFIKKTQDKPGSRPFTAGGATRKGTDLETSANGQPRTFRMTDLVPGLILDELQVGEEPQGFSANGTDEKFGTFEEAIIQAVAWYMEVPPEIMRLAFSNNYSASQAAINEFKMYLNKTRTWWGQNFCQPIYAEWLLSVVLARRIDAPGLLDAWRDPEKYDVLGSWISADWAGHIKPAVDQSKLVGGYKEMVAEGFITRDRASRELTGTKYSKNAAKLRRENELLAEARKPLQPPEPATEPPSQEDTGEDDTQQDDEKPIPFRKAS